jgi:cardiolipin synthase
MTTANKITILRILLVPFFVAQLIYYAGGGDELYRLLAMLSFATAAILDGVDGYIARRYHQQTELGALLDPVADKLLLVSGLITLSFDHRPVLEQLPLWLVVTVFSRDVIILVGMAVIHYTCGKVTVRPHVIGKIATVLQMITIAWTLLKWNAGWLGYWSMAAAIGTGISGLLYISAGVRQLSASPASSARPRP